MKKLSFVALITLSLMIMLVMIPVTVNAQEAPVQHGPNFVDSDGDGYNDNAPDIDGDGIPNGQDPDYVRAANPRKSAGFVDTDGDGFNDNAPDTDGDGIPNGRDTDYKRPADGSGRQFMRGNRNQLRTADSQSETGPYRNGKGLRGGGK